MTYQYAYHPLPPPTSYRYSHSFHCSFTNATSAFRVLANLKKRTRASPFFSYSSHLLIPPLLPRRHHRSLRPSCSPPTARQSGRVRPGLPPVRVTRQTQSASSLAAAWATRPAWCLPPTICSATPARAMPRGWAWCFSALGIPACRRGARPVVRARIATWLVHLRQTCAPLVPQAPTAA